jgi:hypothetical protein
MTSEFCSAAEFYNRLFKKLYEDVFEAYARTPTAVSSKPYIERALRLVKAGLTYSAELLEECSKGN